MNIYFPHSKQLEYEEYYRALRSSPIFSSHTLFLPYEKSPTPSDSRSLIKKADLIIAEVSYPGTGLGIELGWADALKKRIICVYEYNRHIAGSLKYVSKDIMSYNDYPDLIKKCEELLKEIL